MRVRSAAVWLGPGLVWLMVGALFLVSSTTETVASDGAIIADGTPWPASEADATQRDHSGLGILLRDDGEFTEYNETAYFSLKKILLAQWPTFGLPDDLLDVDEGKYFIDKAHPFDAVPHSSPEPHDAMGYGHDEGIVPNVPAPSVVPIIDPLDVIVQNAALPTHAYLPDGRQMRFPDWWSLRFDTDGVWYLGEETEFRHEGPFEPDIIEVMALTVYRDWLKMDNQSPRDQQMQLALPYIVDRLHESFPGATIVTAHAMYPGVRQGESLDDAAAKLVAARVKTVIDVSIPSIPTDATDRCLYAPMTEAALRADGFEGDIIRASPVGLDPAWAEATARFVDRETQRLPAQGRVSVYLTHTGAPVGDAPCGGTESYHDMANEQFDGVVPAVDERLRRNGVTIRQVFATGANGTDAYWSLWEAMEEDRTHGTEHILVVPYESWADGVDNLVHLRESLGLRGVALSPATDHTTAFMWGGMDVTVTSAYFSPMFKADALVHQVMEAAP